MKHTLDILQEKHIEKFGVKPYVLGIFWYDMEELAKNIEDSIEKGTPYNEYDLLTEEEQQAFDNGMLLF